jgi:hypothetical protein
MVELSTLRLSCVFAEQTGKPSPAKELEPEAAFIQGPPSELKRYSVLGLVADRHMLVVDNVTGSTWLLKVSASALC